MKAFSSYCRVVSGIAQSGQVTRRGRASKQGNHYLKWALSQAAVHAVRCYPKVRRYYEQQMKRHHDEADRSGVLKRAARLGCW